VLRTVGGFSRSRDPVGAQFDGVRVAISIIAKLGIFDTAANAFIVLQNEEIGNWLIRKCVL
ncbi:hypothetical protein J1614_003876, partial [Plenodomus biglobosus]